MISLKRNNKGHLVEAKGKRQRANTIYTPGQNDDFSFEMVGLTSFSGDFFLRVETMKERTNSKSPFSHWCINASSITDKMEQI